MQVQTALQEAQNRFNLPKLYGYACRYDG